MKWRDVSIRSKEEMEAWEWAKSNEKYKLEVELTEGKSSKIIIAKMIRGKIPDVVYTRGKYGLSYWSRG